MFSSYNEDSSLEFSLDINGSVGINGGIVAGCSETGRDLCEAVFNGVMTLDQVEGMLVETAVDKARGNLSAAARLLGLTRRQLSYRLSRLHENEAIQ